MKVLRFIPIVFSFILLAAHFSRADLNILAILTIILPFLLFIKKAWVARVIQIALLFGAVEWIRVLFEYVEIRKQIEQDWIKLAVILSVVSLFMIFSALIFQNKAMKRLYKLK